MSEGRLIVRAWRKGIEREKDGRCSFSFSFLNREYWFFFGFLFLGLIGSFIIFGLN